MLYTPVRAEIKKKNQAILKKKDTYISYTHLKTYCIKREETAGQHCE